MRTKISGENYEVGGVVDEYINTDFKKIYFKIVNWIELARDSAQRRELTLAAMDFQITLSKM
jgi:hypothetical protein